MEERVKLLEDMVNQLKGDLLDARVDAARLKEQVRHTLKIGAFLPPMLLISGVVITLLGFINRP